ncbi:MAG: ATP-dependent Clp protease proteolytic subunit [Planctomycetota bacterium]|nr:ATP-dependent Clp protease proteolytic subunit [Planctomycetota bacterium]
MTSKSKGSARSLLERHLLKSRSVLLFGPIEPKLTKDIFQRILVLNAADDTRPIKLLINSPGGVADDGFAIYDLIKSIKAPVTTIVTGLAASAATIVMVAPPKEQRLILPNSRVMLHQPSSGVQGTASDIAISAKEIIRLRKKANELFVRETGQALEKLEDDMHRDYWMNAQESVEYGLVDRVVESLDEF